MSRDSTVIPFRQPDAIDDPLTELAREGARRMLSQALIAEADAFVAMWKDLKLPDGRDRVVRHGHGPQRAIQTGVGPVEVRRAKVRDRGEVGAMEKIRFSSSILPKWARRTKSLDALLPVLYLRGVSTGDFQEALAALLGKDAPNLSPAAIARLTVEWQADYDAWRRRDLSAQRYVYVWADGVYLQARMEDAAECMLVLIGATPEGKKELVGFQTGVRESAQSWRELLVDIKQPNVLNKVALSVQANMKADLREIYGAPTRAAAAAAIDVFADKYRRSSGCRSSLTCSPNGACAASASTTMSTSTITSTASPTASRAPRWRSASPPARSRSSPEASGSPRICDRAATASTPRFPITCRPVIGATPTGPSTASARTPPASGRRPPRCAISSWSGGPTRAGIPSLPPHSAPRQTVRRRSSRSRRHTRHRDRRAHLRIGPFHPRQQARSSRREQAPRGQRADPPSQHPRLALLSIGDQNLLTHPTLDRLHELGLNGMAKAFAEIEAKPPTSLIPNGSPSCSTA